MRRFLVFAALLSLTACGGPMTPEEEQVPAGSEQSTPAPSTAPGEVNGQTIAICNSNDPYCFCGQFNNNSTRCNQQRSPYACYWNWDNRCWPVNG